MKKLIDATQ